MTKEMVEDPIYKQIIQNILVSGKMTIIYKLKRIISSDLIIINHAI